MKGRLSSFTIWLIGTLVGLAMGFDWPGPWFAPLSTYLGWGLVVLVGIDLVKDFLKKEGAFFKRE